ncbi:MAG: ComF family protein [Verrucomicrobia bacterium]|nr:ComF family protein [Verrucomicrobiota bacterium]
MADATLFIQRAARYIRDGLLGLVYPRACYGCETSMAEQNGYLCEQCRTQLHAITHPMCEVCGQHFSGDLTDSFQCSNCANRLLQFDFARAGYQSRDLARVLVHRYKYNGQFFLASLLGEMLNETLDDHRISKANKELDWILVPVPLHSRRLREREFNQAEELCREISRRRGLKIVNALRRTRYTRRQAMLERTERLTNLRGAFTVSPRSREKKLIVGQRILLVDDVLTTGATASECAQTLYEAGALKVVVITVVRG